MRLTEASIAALFVILSVQAAHCSDAAASDPPANGVPKLLSGLTCTPFPPPPARVAYRPVPDGPLNVTYPPESIAAHEQGRVLIAFAIAGDESVSSPYVLQSSGYPRLDAAALAAAATWRFKLLDTVVVPSMRYGDNLYVTFTLGEGRHAVAKATAGESCLTPPPAPVIAAAPVALSQPLVYPDEAIDDREEGRVRVAFTIQADGSVADASVLQSSGHPLLDQAAIDSVNSWKYRPPPFAVHSTVWLDFKLPDSAPAQ